MSEVLSDSVRVARRRSRTCDQCLRLIDIGQRYRRQVHTVDGFQEYTAHEDCDEVASKLTALAGSALNSDEVVMLHDGVDESDRDWVTKDYPNVALRVWPPTWRI